MDPFKIVILGLLAAIVASLGTGLFHLVQGQNRTGTRGPPSAEREADDARRAAEHSRKLARALTVRVVLSVTLFVVIIVGWYTGHLAPHGAGR